MERKRHQLIKPTKVSAEESASIPSKRIKDSQRIALLYDGFLRPIKWRQSVK